MYTLTIPLPSFDDATVKQLTKALDGMKKAAANGPIRGGVASEGDASAYALVWEWGNARQTQKGPKTVLGTNPDGQQVWLSIQAPFGYIRVHADSYEQILMEELEKANFGDLTADSIVDGLEKASAAAAERIITIIKQTVPVDSGELQESITAVDSDDPDLKDSGIGELGTKSFQWKGPKKP